MPFEIVRNDIANMSADAIVNTASPSPVIGYGVDAAINEKAGKKLIEKRREIGEMKVGDAAITPGFELAAKYVIHVVAPVWQGGINNEAQLLRRCYDRALSLALENGCESVAFPLISSGNHGFPKAQALQIAINAFSEFLITHEMQIYLVVFSRNAFALSEKLFSSVQSYIDERYIAEKIYAEYGVTDKAMMCESRAETFLEEMQQQRRRHAECSACAPMPSAREDTLEEMLKGADAGFSETLLKLIDKTGKKDSEIYKKANVDRKLFSKIRNNPEYRPSKSTAIAFAIALELDLAQTKAFIEKAGFALSHSSKADIIIEYFISNGIYDMFKINETLFAFDQNLLGA